MTSAISFRRKDESSDAPGGDADFLGAQVEATVARALVELRALGSGDEAKADESDAVISAAVRRTMAALGTDQASEWLWLCLLMSAAGGTDA